MNARALSENLAALLRREHDALAEFLVALAEFDRDRGWAELGHASLFAYLHKELGLSKAGAQYRKVAVELIQEVPAVVEALRSGRLCFTSIIEAARVVTPENWEAVLPQFYGLSRREAVGVVATLQPHPAPPTRTVMGPVRVTIAQVRPAAALPAVVEAPETAEPALECAPETATATASSTVEPGPAVPAPAPRSLELVPLSAEKQRLHVTVSAAFARKLEEARAARPDLSDEALLDAGLDLLLAQSARRKGHVERPLKNPRPSKPDHIPAHVKREVWARDGGRCQFRLASGEICGSTHGLQFDHVKPRALGGASTTDNVRIACAPHNREAARRVFGDSCMDRYAGKRGRAARRLDGPEATGAPSRRRR